MSGKAGYSGDGTHGPVLIEGVTTALSWLTVFPVQGASTFDRVTGARAMAGLPVAGLALGLTSAVIAYPLLTFGAHEFLVAALTVIAWELGSRMMHIDGLSDVGDALGSYAPPDKAQEILSDRYTGALGMGAVLLTLLAQVAGLTALYHWGPIGAIIAASIPMLARACATIGCHSSFSPFSATGFGALIIGTVKAWWVLAWVVAIGVAVVLVAVGVDKQLAWGAVAACFTTPLAALLLLRHCSRRFNGLNGDCIGAAIEVGAAVAAVTLGIAN
ncbi:adenosylcobinamide-GDP ribazoletransferase [Corynebacterium hindlerae]|uniref:adenosylcobinamide-GDP ribazoletransferase n=1 Tax=Corynebacterium hindlerae TaxID=699041 RepID=UPI001AD63AC8|nr:adenosylcobinamide-GDP ribazoletransferase [Corynebacterium hindlerae]QTH59121.1 adenosylcobinamide-GDP ribazoletransferase [Corynebacterium hindlerae]